MHNAIQTDCTTHPHKHPPFSVPLYMLQSPACVVYQNGCPNEIVSLQGHTLPLSCIWRQKSCQSSCISASYKHVAFLTIALYTRTTHCSPIGWEGLGGSDELPLPMGVDHITGSIVVSHALYTGRSRAIHVQSILRGCAQYYR